MPRGSSFRPLKHCVFINPETLPEDYDPATEIDYVDIGNVDQTRGIVSVEKMNFGDAPSRARRLVRNGDTIISTVRTYLKAVAPIEDPPENMVVSTGFAVLRPGPDVHPKFLAWLAQSDGFVQRVEAHSVGVSYPAISPSVLGSLSVHLPAVGDQRTTAAFLDRETARIDELIAKKERLIDLLAATLDSFVSARTTDGASAHRPGWKSFRLRAITALLQTGPFGSQLHAEDYIEDGIPVINPSNIVERSIVPDSRVAVSEATTARLSRHKLQPFDIVFARRGEMGRCGLVATKQAGWICGTGSLLVRLRTDRVDPRFLIEYLNTSYVAEYLQQYSVGSTMENLNTHIIARLPITLPSLSVQARIVDEIDAKRKAIHNLRDAALRGVQLLTEYRADLISAAVAGQIDVRTYRKEPKAVLETT